MDKFTHLSDFLGYLFDDERTVRKAQAITTGILRAHSLYKAVLKLKVP